VSRTLSIAAVQAAALPIGTPLDDFAADVQRHADAGADLVVYPELHLFGSGPWPAAEDAQRRRAASVPLDGAFVERLGDIARDAGVWLVPGSICEHGEHGELFNTALTIAPDGALAASYRKIFPWRPYEIFTPGETFVVFDVPGIGRFGFSICYDAWFPEVARHVAWMGAEVIVNPTRTTTSDRAQELVLARANAIVNQVFVISANAAAPLGVGCSLIVDPEGRVRVTTDEASATVLTDVLDLDEVTRVREFGTAGLNRMWNQFEAGDPALELPLYAGRIDPTRWRPGSAS